MRKCLFAIAILALVLSFSLPALADAPDKDVKLRVFVHYPKPGKPAPRPGVCDPSAVDSDVYGVTGWTLAGPTVTYRVNYGTVPSSVSNAQTAIRSSFGAWQSDSVITFVEGSPTSARGYRRDGQNVVVWGNVPSGAIAVTYTWYNSVTHIAVEVDTVMSKSLPWAYTATTNPDQECGNLYTYDVQNILTHEVGHWMGLNDLYTESEHDLTMYGYGAKGELKKDTLGTGDVDGIKAIY